MFAIDDDSPACHGHGMWRRFSCALLLAAAPALTLPAAGASSTPAATRACLLRSGARLDGFAARVPYPEVVGQVVWQVGSEKQIYIVFARDARRARTLQ